MKTESSLAIVDVRDEYLKWNSLRVASLDEELGENKASLLQLLPLLLQINHRMLPGYIAPDVPVGVYLYKPDNDVLNVARKLNDKFRYQQDEIVRSYVIDAIYVQISALEKQLTCWVFRRDGLTDIQLQLLTEKLSKIETWLNSHGLEMRFNFLTESTFKSDAGFNGNIPKSIFLDYFYAEAVFLAGKYPVWWLVPPQNDNAYHAFVEHIREARFVEGEYIDLGSTHELTYELALQYAVAQAQQVKKEPELCLVKLLIADQKCRTLPSLDGLSIRIKQAIYNQQKVTHIYEIFAAIIDTAFEYYRNKQHVYAPSRIFSNLKNSPGKLNPKILDACLGGTVRHETVQSGIDNIISYLNLFKAVSHEIRQLFSSIYGHFSEHNKQNVALDRVARNMLVFLSESSDRVPLYNNKNKTEIIFDRIQLRHKIEGEHELWSLVLYQSEGDEKTIEGFNSLLGLLAWCWLNRLVNHSTQVSIDCPKQQIRQTEARYVLEILMQKINPQAISDIPAEAFENPVRPLQSLLFINFTANKNFFYELSSRDDPLSFGENSNNLITHCEQLILNSWGDVYTKQYAGNRGVVQCLCDWMHYAPINDLSRPPPLESFGHGTGDSTHMAQRVMQVYAEMLDFFYNRRPDSGRFLLRLGNDYYQVQQQDNRLQPQKVGDREKLLQYLESSSDHYVSTQFESLAYPEEPLKDIYQRNKPDVFQVFYRINGRGCTCWVLDEKGSLWRNTVKNYDRESFITHWLYLYRNMQQRLNALQSAAISSPAFEMQQISFNQLGGIEFYTIGVEGISGNKTFFDIQIHIDVIDTHEQLSLVCDEKNFSYKIYRQNALIECVQYLAARMLTNKNTPVYVTDMSAPLKTFDVNNPDDLQTTHLLKLKRSIERKMLKLLAG